MLLCMHRRMRLLPPPLPQRPSRWHQQQQVEQGGLSLVDSRWACRGGTVCLLLLLLRGEEGQDLTTTPFSLEGMEGMRRHAIIQTTTITILSRALSACLAGPVYTVVTEAEAVTTVQRRREGKREGGGTMAAAALYLQGHSSSGRECSRLKRKKRKRKAWPCQCSVLCVPCCCRVRRRLTVVWFVWGIN